MAGSEVPKAETQWFLENIASGWRMVVASHQDAWFLPSIVYDLGVLVVRLRD